MSVRSVVLVIDQLNRLALNLIMYDTRAIKTHSRDAESYINHENTKTRFND